MPLALRLREGSCALGPMTQIRRSLFGAALMALLALLPAIACSSGSDDEPTPVSSPVGDATAAAAEPTVPASDAPPGPTTFPVIGGRSEG